MKKKYKTHILVLDEDDPERELQFKIDYQLSLTAAERYEIMDRLVRDGLRKYEHTKIPKIITRI